MDDVVANTTDHLPHDISDADWKAFLAPASVNALARVYRHSRRRLAPVSPAASVLRNTGRGPEKG